MVMADIGFCRCASGLMKLGHGTAGSARRNIRQAFRSRPLYLCLLIASLATSVRAAENVPSSSFSVRASTTCQWSAISPCANYVACAGDDGSIRIWQILNGSIYWDLKAHVGKIDAVVFSSSGEYLASGGSDKTIKVWNLKGRRLLRSLDAQNSPTKGLTFSPAGNRLASAFSDGAVKVWSLPHGMLVSTFALSGGQPFGTHIAFSPSGEYLAVTDSASRVRSLKIWRLSDGSLLRKFEGTYFSVAFSPSGEYLAGEWRAKFKDSRQAIRIWHLNDATRTRPFREIPLHGWPGHRLVFDPSGKHFLTYQEGAVKIWRTSDGRMLETLPFRGFSLPQLAFSQTGDKIFAFSANLNGEILSWKADFAKSDIGCRDDSAWRLFHYALVVALLGALGIFLLKERRCLVGAIPHYLVPASGVLAIGTIRRSITDALIAHYYGRSQEPLSFGDLFPPSLSFGFDALPFWLLAGFVIYFGQRNSAKRTLWLTICGLAGCLPILTHFQIIAWGSYYSGGKWGPTGSAITEGFSIPGSIMAMAVTLSIGWLISRLRIFDTLEERRDLQ